MKISNSGFFGFTLIELMVAITIVSILMLASYIPYQHHQKKMALNQAAREISQTLSEARNLAIHGLDTGSGNLTLALVFEPGSNHIDYYTYPHTQIPNLTNLIPEYKFKIKELPRGITIDSINTRRDVPFLLSFFAISGTGSSTEEKILIQISYQGSDSPILQKQIVYYTKSYVSDYF